MKTLESAFSVLLCNCDRKSFFNWCIPAMLGWWETVRFKTIKFLKLTEWFLFFYDSRVLFFTGIRHFKSQCAFQNTGECNKEHPPFLIIPHFFQTFWCLDLMIWQGKRGVLKVRLNKMHKKCDFFKICAWQFKKW